MTEAKRQTDLQANIDELEKFIKEIKPINEQEQS